MKKVFILALLLFGSIKGYSQQPVFDDWFVSGGFNIINNLGTRNPFASPSDWAFKTPFTLSGEKQIARDWNI
jgi:hypothetical protein